ncbi:olfactory receptor 5V1-like [Rhinophrynus dorsalis]
MDRENYTTITRFTLVGLSQIHELQILLFIVFLMSYVITVLGNVSIIFAYKLSSHLHTPMYFFLTNLSLLEVCYVSVTVPKLLSVLLAEEKTISFYGCGIQMYWFLLLGIAECYMLASMGYDRYNAICHPLIYNVIMNKRECIKLVAGSWLIGAGNALIHTVLTFTLPFCGTKINNFFCDIPPLLKLSCTNTWVNEIIVILVSGGVTVSSLILIMISYIQIISTILNISSSSGRRKTFSTCSSHFTVVSVFYGSGFCMYFRPKSSYRMDQDSLISVMYTVIAPLLNPFIYSLRNNDVKNAVKTMLSRIMK